MSPEDPAVGKHILLKILSSQLLIPGNHQEGLYEARGVANAMPLSKLEQIAPHLGTARGAGAKVLAP